MQVRHPPASDPQVLRSLGVVLTLIQPVFVEQYPPQDVDFGGHILTSGVSRAALIGLEVVALALF